VGGTNESSWLLLIHQIPPKPAYFRVKIWRRLQSLGALALKNSVYALPNTDEAREDFEWVLREIVKEGGEATLCEARLIEGLGDDEVQRAFHAARDADYAQIAETARKLDAEIPRKGIPEDRRSQVEADVARLRHRLTDVGRIDFFAAPGREAAEGLVSALEARLRPAGERMRTDHLSLDDLRDRVWVTRKGIHIDRIASAWLIRQFVDANARFKFVPSKGYRPEARELRFDMFEAEFTHEGDLCTFEVLLSRLGLNDGALVPIAEIVHDIDLKDRKFDRPDTAGIDRLILGIAMGYSDDESRLERGFGVFDGLYQYFSRKRG
jgi:hypothetical protein